MTYEEQLLSQEWKQKRKTILQRDHFRCQICFNKKLLDNFRISFDGAGTTQTKLLYIVFDEHTGQRYRCNTPYNNTFLLELLRISEERFIIALSYGNNAFCELVATIILPDKIEYNAVLNVEPDTLDYHREKQYYQESCLRGLSTDGFKRLQWLDTKGLHVHHTYYQLGKFAWQYPDDALVTLCWDCHESLHANTTIDVKDEYGYVIGLTYVCPKCHGAGHFPRFNHVQNGVCFQCSGDRFVYYT